MNHENIDASAEVMESFHQYLGSMSKSCASTKDASGYLLDTDATSPLPSHASHASVAKISLTEHNKQMRTKKSEIVGKQTEIANLKRRLTSVESCNKKIKLQQSQELENIKQALQKSYTKVEEMRADKLKMFQKQGELQDELDRFKKIVRETKTSQQKDAVILQKENHKLSEELKKLSASSQSTVFELKKENMSLQSELIGCQSQLNECQEQMQNLNRKLTTMGNASQELEETKLLKLQGDHKIKELEGKLSQVQEDALIVKIQTEKLCRMPEIERENRMLKDENQYYKDTTENVLLLKEEVISLKQKLERYEKRLAELCCLELEHKEMKTQILQWEKCFSSIGVDKRHPDEIPELIAELQNDKSHILEKDGHLQTTCEVLEQSVERLQNEIKSYMQDLNTEREKTAGHTNFIKRLQRKLLLVTKERDGFREIIQTYENEVTLSITAPLTSQHKQPSMKELDGMMMGYQKQVSQLEAELDKVTKQSVHYRTSIQTLEDRLNSSERLEAVPSITSVAQADEKIIYSLREKVAHLENIVANIREEKEILEARIEQRNLQGDYDPTKTKVLHFGMNPAAKAQIKRKEELKQLIEENEKLRKKISLLEESGGAVEDITARVEEKMEEEPASSKELEDVKAQLNSAELKNKRLIEAFKTTSHQLRSGCFQLTGYRIDMPVPDQFKLMNIYAESADDYLHFQKSNDGDFNLLETQYSTSLKDLIDMYLKQGNSIPAFLGALTLELFKKQTILM